MDSGLGKSQCSLWLIIFQLYTFEFMAVFTNLKPGSLRLAELMQKKKVYHLHAAFNQLALKTNVNS